VTMTGSPQFFINPRVGVQVLVELAPKDRFYYRGGLVESIGVIRGEIIFAVQVKCGGYYQYKVSEDAYLGRKGEQALKVRHAIDTFGLPLLDMWEQAYEAHRATQEVLMASWNAKHTDHHWSTS
jgi:hypothetical protein